LNLRNENGLEVLSPACAIRCISVQHAFEAVMHAESKLTVSESLSQRTSAEAGRWRTARRRSMN
jgi:hypothetical protein